MRAVRTLGAVLVWLVATVLLTLAIVLCVTVVLSPVGLLLGFASIRLFKLGASLILPRARDVKKGVRKEFRRWRRSLRIRPARRLGRSRSARWRRR